MKFGRDGLIPVVVQDHLTGDIRMVAHATIEAVRATLEIGARDVLEPLARTSSGRRGCTSGNTPRGARRLVDCDEDCLIYSAEPMGATCHTGAPSCFFQTLERGGRIHQHGATPQTLLARLEAQIEARKREHGGQELHEERSSTGARRAIGAKLREEADELALAIANESDERVANEAADVVYHLLVALRSRDVSWSDVLRARGAERRERARREALAPRTAAAGRIGRGTIP